MEITLLSAATDEFLAGVPDDTALALGLTWAPMTAGLQKANAQSMALSAKATHLVHANGKSSVGLARMSRVDVKQLAKSKVTRVVSAASLLAAIKPVGTSLVTLSISGAGQEPDGEEGVEGAGSGDGELVWLGAVSNGVVLRGHDCVVTTERADELWRALQERYNGNASRFDEVSGFGWSDLVELARERQPDSAASMSLLLPVKAGSLGLLRNIPKPAKYLGAILGCAALFQYLVIPVAHYEIAKYKRAHGPKVDTRSLWEAAYHQWAMTHKVAGRKAGVQVLIALGEVPTPIAKWSMSNASCEMDTARSRWNCAVSYKWPSTGVGDTASTNALFASSAPRDWILDWSPMTSVTGRFFVQAATSPLDTSHLQPEGWHLVHSVSYLQRFDRVLNLSSKPLTKFARVAIQAPRSKSGQVVPAPAGLQFPLVAKVRVDGPLRTMVGKMVDMPDVSWEKVDVTIDSNVKPDRNKSELKATLQGEIYAKP
ncbi:MAG: hypothetical protein EPN64_04555 [Burkholderiaceae bacterium]|nr:MAG: hypothetical protein EPN64_04555 [Burkholderiaceae bacterium]